MTKQLYFIALLPPEEIRQDVRQLKLGMKKRFDASHALKSPAHITLQIPFRREEKMESEMIGSLQKFAADQSKFMISLNGFGSFLPRVLFIKIEDHQPVQNLHSKMNVVLINSLSFTQKEIKQQLHPHLTIATRDLSKAAFHDAWTEYKDREFRASFDVNSLYLLKHNGKFWDVFREFPFNT
ncbi:MAG: 2'-5' RNA ligase family protein [Balneolaceae bacterium]